MTDAVRDNDPEIASPLATALLGAAAGAFGVWALDRLDWWMWRHEDAEATAETTAVRPNGEPPAESLVIKTADATGVRPSPESHALASQLVHYSIGIAPAIGYALFRDRLPGRGASRGALFGLGLFLGEDELLNPIAGLAAKPQAYPWQAHARGLLAHTLYGIATEFALDAAQRALAVRASTRSERRPGNGTAGRVAAAA